MLAAIVASPGLTYAELGTVLGVSEDTAGRYVGRSATGSTPVAGPPRAVPGPKSAFMPSPHRRTSPHTYLRRLLRENSRGDGGGESRTPQHPI